VKNIAGSIGSKRSKVQTSSLSRSVRKVFILLEYIYFTLIELLNLFELFQLSLK